MLRHLYISILCFFCFCSCGKKEAQLPANKGETELEIQTNALRTINQELVAQQDSFLHQFVRENESGFSKHSSGFFYKKTQITGSLKPKEKDICTFKYVLSLIDGTKIEKSEKSITIGRKEIPVGLEEGLLLLSEGEKAIFYLPSSLAFGMKGYQQSVPPYTPVIYEVELTKIKTFE